MDMVQPFDPRFPEVSSSPHGPICFSRLLFEMKYGHGETLNLREVTGQN